MIRSFKILLFSFVAIAAYGQEQMTLEQAIEYAYSNSLDLKMSDLSIKDAREQIIEQRSVGIPSIFAGFDVNRSLALPTSLIPAEFLDDMAMPGEFTKVRFGTKNSFRARIDLTTQIFDFSYFIGLRAARSFKGLKELERDQTRYETKYKVVETYIPVMLLEDSKKILLKDIDNVKKLFFETSELYKAGFIEQLDVDRIELSLSNLETELSNIDRQIELAYNFLKFQINYPLEKELIVTDNVESLFVPALTQELLDDFDMNNRPEYLVLERTKYLNELNVKVNRSRYYPTFTGFATLNYEGQGDKIDAMFWSPISQIGMSVNIPIFDGLDKKAKVGRAKLNLEMVKQRQSFLENSISLELQNARTNYNSAFERLESQEKNLRLAQKIYDTTQIKYKEGIGSSVELSQAEQSLYNSQRNHLFARYELLESKWVLDKALGK